MTDKEIDEVVSKAVKETLVSMGFQPDNPLEAQKDFQFLRSWRTSSEAVKRQGLTSAVAVIIAGLLGLMWLTIKEVIK